MYILQNRLRSLFLNVVRLIVTLALCLAFRLITERKRLTWRGLVMHKDWHRKTFSSKTKTPFSGIKVRCSFERGPMKTSYVHN
jgi:hypothetical protein